jgi:hypothetical protein
MIVSWSAKVFSSMSIGVWQGEKPEKQGIATGGRHRASTNRNES